MIARTIAHTGDAFTTAQLLNNALQDHGHRVVYGFGENGEPSVWLSARGDMLAVGQFLKPGQQVVLEHDGSFRIEDAPAKEAS